MKKLSVLLLCYLVFSAVVISAYLYYRPSWGVVDDWQHIQTVNPAWESGNFLQSLIGIIKSDLDGGKVRTIHWIYASIVYRVFDKAPYLIYIFNFLAQMAILPLWGLIFHKMFSKDKVMSHDTIFLFPLSFFIFTPFWNNFMYICVQEKLVFFFSSIAIYFYILTYEKNKTRYLLLSFIFALLCLFSKPTGVYIILTLLACSFLYCFLYRKKLILPCVSVLVSLSVLAAYYLLIKSLVKPGGYSSKYMDNFNIAAVLTQLNQSSIVVKALFGLAILSLPSYLVLIKKKYFNPSAVLIPVAFISYLVVILPWGTSNYLLGPLAPFALGIFFPFYGLSKERFAKFKLGYLPNLAIVLLVGLVLAQIIIPRINKIAEIKDVRAQIIRLNRDNADVRFFFPPDYPEHPFALSQFTKAEISYLSGYSLGSKALSKGPNYLIYSDESSMIRLSDVKLGNLIFEDNTWKIFEVLESPGNTEMLHVFFPQTFLQKVVKLLKKS